MERLATRKFILAAATLLITALLVWFAKISDGVFSAVVIAVVGAFITGDIVERWVERTPPDGQ